MKTLTLPLPDDFHVHLRQGELLKNYAKTVAKEFGRILVMPNTVPPIASAENVRDYYAQIKSAAPQLDLLMMLQRK